MSNLDKILSVRNLTTSFQTQEGNFNAVDDVSFDVYRGKTLGIVGESGCGKSVSCLSIMRLIANPPGKIKSGEILYRGVDLLKLESSKMRAIRGNEISMIFQDPMTSLNPVFTVGNQIREAIGLHQKKLTTSEIRDQAIEMLKLVGIPAPEKRVHDYPHQLSGGMRQRVMIAMALSCNPQILIADEPTTALDVTIQAQILELLKELQQKMGMALILITHDLGVVAEMADELVVMYAGQVVEQGQVRDIFREPKMPYTRGLLNSIPNIKRRQARLEAIPGIVPNLLKLPQGCRFQERCSYVLPECKQSELELRVSQVHSGHLIRCLREI